MSNANLPVLAHTLATAHKGFTGVIVTKVGVEKGGVRYEDDTVHSVIVTGFKYTSLVERSLDKAQSLTDTDLDSVVARGLHGWERVWKKSGTLDELRVSCTNLGLDTTGKKADLIARLEAAVPGGFRKVTVTRAHVDQALMDLTDSLQRSLSGDTDSTNGHVFEPLTFNGEVVRGARVYIGPPDDTKKPASPKGTIYLQGLMIGQKVLTPAANGRAPESMSAPTQVAKEALKRLLPVSRYVSYKLEPGGNWILNVGGMAATAAENDGIPVSTETTYESLTI